GTEQQSQWPQVREIKPDWVILWGWGVMNPTALKTAAKIGYPREKIIGVWWSGAEEDVLPAGSAAKGYISAGFNAPGSDFPVMKDIKKYVYDKGKGEFEDKSRFGSIYHTRLRERLDVAAGALPANGSAACSTSNSREKNVAAGTARGAEHQGDLRQRNPSTKGRVAHHTRGTDRGAARRQRGRQEHPAQ